MLMWGSFFISYLIAISTGIFMGMSFILFFLNRKSKGGVTNERGREEKTV